MSEPQRLSPADYGAWRRVEDAIFEEARRLCAESCAGGLAKPCAGCDAGRHREWRRDALNSLKPLAEFAIEAGVEITPAQQSQA